MNRSVWTLLVPTVCAAFPWFLMRYAEHDPVTNRVGTTTQVLYVAVPAAGVVSVVVWGLCVRQLLRLWPLLPYAVVTAGYCTAELAIWLNYAHADVLEGTTEWFGDVMMAALVLMLAQPVCAVVGGLLSLPAPAGPAERKPPDSA